ncbi:MAG: hypothetical protein ACKO0W_03420, partial [Planctomycetota bacterium]
AKNRDHRVTARARRSFPGGNTMLAPLLAISVSVVSVAGPLSDLPDPGRILQQAIEAATKVESIELRVAAPGAAEFQRVWVIPATAGQPESARLRVESRDAAAPQSLRTTEAVGYVVTDVNKSYDDAVVDELRAVAGTIRFRVLY